MKRDWLGLYEEQHQKIWDNFAWWEAESPIGEHDLQEIADGLHDLQKEMQDYNAEDLDESEPDLVERYTRDMNKAARVVVDSYTPNQIKFAIDFLTGKYD